MAAFRVLVLPLVTGLRTPTVNQGGPSVALPVWNPWRPPANAMYMGSQEMVQVLGRDDSTIRQNLDKLIFYYGATDQWCPVQYYHDIKGDFPTGTSGSAGRGIGHAFVLDAGREVAAMVTEWIRDDVENA
ncbi:hypothetical protein SKAU_G00419330 [Synaphobranchus kaupii]|uniref:Uncharacterized protein n=1 Tax=Synaphobranchus kaupii TaxID=118154 RepID=A0A9Q1E6F0_SYNKA|nr:hypothetical protein SKAU_G00419330 [Synaphobranchus kaupii]